MRLIRTRSRPTATSTLCRDEGVAESADLVRGWNDMDEVPGSVPSGTPDLDKAEDTKQCPHCAETIRAEAKVCRFCGRELSGTSGKGPFLGLSKTTLVIIASALVAAGAIAWAILAAADKSKSSAEPEPNTTFTIDGTLTASECGGGYEIEFASVEVRDQNDKLIGSSTTSGDESSRLGCVVTFEVEVPKASFYQVQIGTHGGPSYSFKEMEAVDWQMDLSL